MGPYDFCKDRDNSSMKVVEDKLMEYGIMQSVEDNFLFSTDYSFKMEDEPKKMDMFEQLPNMSLGISFEEYDFLEDANTIFH